MTKDSTSEENKEPAKRASARPKKGSDQDTRTPRQRDAEKAEAVSKEETARAPKAAAVKVEKTKKPSKRPEVKLMFTGRRKESVSRAKLVKGKGEVTINGKTLNEYFKRSVDQYKVKQPLVLLGLDKEFDVFANVHGGGTTGQSEAIRLSISRSLDKMNPAYHQKLKEFSLLTRDSRMVERKKYGLHKARRASQFSKR
ncbi:MAG: 30S ribosomal protein S9 [Spirochaetia bacterium]|nr:30S ribosomal protein S9 [Spirochaetia bacterium]